jgi:hypothetical protein
MSLQGTGEGGVELAAGQRSHTVTVPKLIRGAGMLLLNLLLALFGANTFDAPLYDAFDWHGTSAMLMREYFLTGGISFALGYIVYHRWRPVPSRWLCSVCHRV